MGHYLDNHLSDCCCRPNYMWIDDNECGSRISRWSMCEIDGLIDWLIIESNWMKCSANFNLFYRKRRRYSLWHLRFALIMTALVSTTYWLTILTARTCLGKYPFKSFTWFVNKLWIQQQVTGCQSLSYLPLDLSSSTKLDTRECISKLVVYPVYQSPIPPSPLSPLPLATRLSMRSTWSSRFFYWHCRQAEKLKYLDKPKGVARNKDENNNNNNNKNVRWEQVMFGYV